MASHGAELHPDGKIRIRKTLIKDTEKSFRIFRNEWVKHTKNYFKQFGLNVKVSK